jgi:hypothetical protein
MRRTALIASVVRVLGDGLLIETLVSVDRQRFVQVGGLRHSLFRDRLGSRRN